MSDESDKAFEAWWQGPHEQDSRREYCRAAWSAALAWQSSRAPAEARGIDVRKYIQTCISYWRDSGDVPESEWLDRLIQQAEADLAKLDAARALASVRGGAK